MTVRVLTDTRAETVGDYRVACECPIDGVVQPALLQLERSPEGTCLILGIDKVFDEGTPGEGVNGVLFSLRFIELSRRFIVEVKGDFIRDEKDISLDGNHLAPWLPNRATGDGVAGGLFESWFTAVDALPERPNINATDLRGLLEAGLKPDIAKRVLAERAARNFTNASDLRTRLGLTAAEIKDIGLLTTTG
jgi:hypothetical protein